MDLGSNLGVDCMRRLAPYAPSSIARYTTLNTKSVLWGCQLSLAELTKRQCTLGIYTYSSLLALWQWLCASWQSVYPGYVSICSKYILMAFKYMKLGSLWGNYDAPMIFSGRQFKRLGTAPYWVMMGALPCVLDRIVVGKD